MKKTMILHLNNDLNELLLDKVAIERKKGNKTNKEKIILSILEKNKEELKWKS